MDYILSIISVFLFAGLTAWDVKRFAMSMIKQMVNLLQAGQYDSWNFILILSTSLSAFFVSSEETTNQRDWAGAVASAFFFVFDLCYTNSD